MKKTVALTLLSVILILPLSGCTQNVNNKEMTLEFTFGTRTGTYTGTLTDNLPNGKGSFTTQSPEGVTWTYEGDWVEGHKSGEGKTTWEDGREAEGTYANDELNGYGKYNYGGSVLYYEGEFKDGVRHGQGKLYRTDTNATYEGTFVNGIPEENEFIQKSEMLPFSTYSKRPQDYYLKPILLAGKIIFITLDGKYIISLIFDNIFDDYSQQVIVTDNRVEKTPTFYNGDVVGVYGFLTGTDSTYHCPSFEAFTIADVFQ